MMPPVTGDNFIASLLPWTHDSRDKYAMFPDALGRIRHLLIIQHFEGMIPEGV